VFLEVNMPDESRKPLRRSRQHRVLAGVCGGLGEFFGLNPLWFRIAFLIALIPGGVPGILAYALGWIIIPEE
jgi:phage shock protein PspC (stress-responsive transcriptional regulator)